MSYGFDDNMGKVPIEPILNNLQTSFQNNINKIYNAIVNQGTNPPGKTPDNIVTGINNLASNKYNAGYSAGDTAGYNRGYSAGDTAGYNRGYNEGKAAAEAVTWVVSMGSTAMNSGVNFDITNVEHVVSVVNTSGYTINYECYNAASGLISSGVVGNGGGVPIAGGTKRIALILDKTGTFTSLMVNVTFQAKAIR